MRWTPSPANLSGPEDISVCDERKRAISVIESWSMYTICRWPYSVAMMANADWLLARRRPPSSRSRPFCRASHPEGLGAMRSGVGIATDSGSLGHASFSDPALANHWLCSQRSGLSSPNEQTYTRARSLRVTRAHLTSFSLRLPSLRPSPLPAAVAAAATTPSLLPTLSSPPSLPSPPLPFPPFPSLASSLHAAAPPPSSSARPRVPPSLRRPAPASPGL